MLPRTLLLRTLRSRQLASRAHATATRSITTPPASASSLQAHLHRRRASHVPHSTVRWLSSKSAADETIEEITELYATAQDEFEIAMEETEKVSVYAEEDRKAAREELTKVQEAYRRAVEGPDKDLGEEVRRRVGQRIRELEQGVGAMEEMALHQD